ncbi:PREDICTED: ribonuclease P protein subunit p29-like [Priapulus caudatus]|uniref:Ribonuclease P protein subunit p29 n=1 Tax=Priapulus caudatus TaxID=37621 RepID=A0ABM1EEB0_PRICU|nr:PREDICTED: ribonuclease P protein subunit p29-like [Priapulus caudatus]
MSTPTQDSAVYSELPAGVKRQATQLKLADDVRDGSAYLSSFLRRHVAPRNLATAAAANDAHQVVLLDTVVPKKRPSSLQKKGRRQLNARERRGVDCFAASTARQTYRTHVPLHTLWRGYMRSLLQLEPSRALAADAQHRLLKADYHGCVLTVARSRCPSLVGVAGIVLQETRCTWRLVTREDRLVTVPKATCVFTFELEGHVVTLYGKHFVHRPADRCSKKFKSKATIDL